MLKSVIKFLKTNLNDRRRVTIKKINNLKANSLANLFILKYSLFSHIGPTKHTHTHTHTHTHIYIYIYIERERERGRERDETVQIKCTL